MLVGQNTVNESLFAPALVTSEERLTLLLGHSFSWRCPCLFNSLLGDALFSELLFDSFNFNFIALANYVEHAVLAVDLFKLLDNFLAFLKMVLMSFRLLLLLDSQPNFSSVDILGIDTLLH